MFWKDSRRLTPTRVGTTWTGALRSAARRAHPHTRGDDRPVVSPLADDTGSPPHAWGRRSRSVSLTIADRLTPTRVGTTHCRGLHRASRRAHPHTRGDDGVEAMYPHDPTGSPPHAWGRRNLTSRSIFTSRLTPTRVGTTRDRPRPFPVTGAHPHTRGDDNFAAISGRSFFGSPPHAWGRPVVVGPAIDTLGLTPTRVGTTMRGRTRRTGTRAHPHTRGDDEDAKRTLPAHVGSPPHAWGRLASARTCWR